jgi:hypothetical protein
MLPWKVTDSPTKQVFWMKEVKGGEVEEKGESSTGGTVGNFFDFLEFFIFVVKMVDFCI